MNNMKTKLSMKYYPKKLRVVAKGNWRDQTDFTRVDDHPSGNLYYWEKPYDLKTAALLSEEQFVKRIVDYKTDGYELVLLQRK